MNHDTSTSTFSMDETNEFFKVIPTKSGPECLCKEERKYPSQILPLCSVLESKHEIIYHSIIFPPAAILTPFY